MVKHREIHLDSPRPNYHKVQFHKLDRTLVRQPSDNERRPRQGPRPPVGWKMDIQTSLCGTNQSNFLYHKHDSYVPSMCVDCMIDTSMILSLRTEHNKSIVLQILICTNPKDFQNENYNSNNRLV